MAKEIPTNPIVTLSKKLKHLGHGGGGLMVSLISYSIYSDDSSSNPARA